MRTKNRASVYDTLRLLVWVLQSLILINTTLYQALLGAWRGGLGRSTQISCILQHPVEKNSTSLL